jgi:hypothetical protein
MDALHPGMAPMIAAWMGGALLSLATAGLRYRVGVRPRQPAPVRATRRVQPRAAGAHR